MTRTRFAPLCSWTAFSALTLAGMQLLSTRLARTEARTPEGQGTQRSNTETLPKLFPNGHFPALHGYFFLEDRTLHVYRALPVRQNAETGKVASYPEDDDLKPKWKGETYYHEVYTLDQGEWVPKVWEGIDLHGKREFSQPPERHLYFSCDLNDELDLQRSQVRAALWNGAKIKRVLDLGNITAVVFSEGFPGGARERRASSELPARSIQVALITHGKKGWVLSSGPVVVSTGRFCGASTLSDTRGGQQRAILLLFLQEADYTVAYSYVAD